MPQNSDVMPSHNLLVLSDVHLGSDLVQCVRPDAPARAPENDQRDAQLAHLLDWYRAHRRNGRPWRLVIAGDLVDFVGMSVAPPRSTSLSGIDADDSTLGLGSAEDHAVYKLSCVARRHETVFRALAEFVGAGNRLVIVRGNHDLDFHWPRVRDEFLHQLASHAAVHRESVEFSPWFYYEQGRVYVEHGHQYDRYCSYEHVLNPVAPENPRRSSRSLSDVLLRQVVRPTRGLTEAGHDKAGALDYARFALGLGIGGMLGLARRFAGAVATLFSIWRAHMSEGAHRIRREHERRMAELADFLNLSIESLRQLSSLHSPPVTTSFRRLALTVMIDRMAMGLLAIVAIALAFVFLPRWHHAMASAAAVLAALWFAGRLLSRARRDIEPSRELRDGASRVARLFPAAFVVMGHTHLPEVTRAEGAATTYVNLGAWAEGADAPGASPLSSRTHLVLHETEDGASVAELFVWDESVGPRRFGDG